MHIRKTITAPGKLAALFVCVTALLLVVIGWLGWRLLAQESALDDQRLRDQLENTAALAARDLDRALMDWETQLPAIAGGQTVSLPENTIAIVFDDKGVLKHWGVDLPYYPRIPPALEVPKALFVEAESLEFTRRDFAGAEHIYRRLARSSDEVVRAAALMRLARTLRHQQRTREAINVYGEMAAIGSTVWVAGSPAELVARRERVALLESIGETGQARQDARMLADVLWSGRLAIDHSTFDFYRESAAPATTTTALSLAHGLEAIWAELQRQETGRAPIAVDESSLVALWGSTPAGLAAVLGRVESVAPVLGRLSLPGFQVTLENESGQTMWGDRNSTNRSAVKTSRESGLPWTLRVTATETAATQRLFHSRRLLQIAGFLLMSIVVVTAGIVTFRAVSRELTVAHLQSEFVATVSHEFRTPLTAMRHLTEMLDEGAASPVRVPHYHRALVKETRRLQGLVESLLDFGRMEAGRRTYRMELSSASELVREVIDELADSPGASRIEFDAPGETDARAIVRADRQAIGLALRNLVDNALKYSPDSAPVRVSVRCDPAAVSISVADHGPGIATGEQRDIFRKFVRGSAAAELRVNGTGIGLAIAEHIVHSHGGRLQLQSEPGGGCCFTIVLPIVAEAA